MAVHYNSTIVNEGLVLCLDAANVKSYPGTGTTWLDLSGNNYTHTLQGGAALTILSGVPAIDCSVEGRYVQVNGATYTFGSTYTLIAWARPLADNQVTNWRTLWRTLPNDHQLLIQDGTNTIGYYDNDSGGFVSYGLNAGTLSIENQWTMFSLVSNGTSTTLWINNLAYSGFVNYTAVGNAHNAFGAAQGSQSFGYLSVAQIYNRALSQIEIQQNFNALRGRYGL